MVNVNSIVWTKCNQNNRFVNLPSLPWLSENSGAIHLALPGLIAGRQVNEMQVNFKIFKIHCTLKRLTFHCI